MLRAAILLVCMAIAPACTAFKGDPNVYVSSEPPGAEIFVDGTPTGFTTPAVIELGGLFAGDREITLRMAGREPETRSVVHHRTTATSRWNDGADNWLLGITLPLWWTFGDFFLPFAVEWQYTPHEVHAVLYETGQAPVQSDPDR